MVAIGSPTATKALAEPKYQECLGKESWVPSTAMGSRSAPVSMAGGTRRP